MRQSLRRRFWLEAAAAAATTIFLVLTLAWHDWIEIVFHADPDAGSGSAEWLVVVVCAVVLICLVILARFELRRARLAGPATAGV